MRFQICPLLWGEGGRHVPKKGVDLVVEKPQLGRSYEHGEEPIGERQKRQKRQKTKNYSTGLHGLVRKGRSYLTMRISVLGEQATGS